VGFKMSIRRILILTLAFLFPAATFAAEPITIAEQGNFYIGGHYVEDNGDQPMIGQMYVQYQIPYERTHALPIVMVHGGSQTGSGFISTPDGREGWATYFLRRGYAVYVVDQSARGRSAYVDTIYGDARRQTRQYVIERFAASERFGAYPQAETHTQWPGVAEPGDPVFDNYFASNVQSMDNRDLQTEMNVNALSELLDKLGPSIVLVHSQSGNYGWPLAQSRPGLLKVLVAVEPTGPPVRNVVIRGEPRFNMPFDDANGDDAGGEDANALYRDDPRVKPYGLTDSPLEYAPAVTTDSPLQFVRENAPQAPDLARCWKQAEPAKQIVAVGDRPILYLASEASFYAPFNHCTIQYLSQAGVNVDYIQLSDIGIHGNGHMMMMEKNSDEVAGVIYDWLEENTPEGD
jgi:pimeloyl-ACP methyl ester carboxylesterase